MVAPLNTGTAHTHTQPSNQIPETLRQFNHWIVWRAGATKNGKFPKIPYDPATGKASDDKNAATWISYSAAKRANHNVGYCLSDDDGLTMVDLDRCATAGTIDPRALQIMQECGGYWEFSPSGTGIKGWVYGKLPNNPTGTINGISVEVYSRNRFGAVTGKGVPGFTGEPIPAQAALDQLAAQLAPTPADDTPRATGPIQPATVISTSATELDIHAQSLLARLRGGKLATSERQRLSTELRATNRAFIQAIASDYNSATTIASELERHGCTYTSGTDDKRYYSGVPGDTHSHTNTLKIAHNRVWSLSPNSRIPNSGKGWTPFDVVTHLDYSGNAAAAARALFGASTPIAQSVAQHSELEPRLSPEQYAAHKADAQRKREARRAEGAADVENALDRAGLDQCLNKGIIDTLLDLATGTQGTRNWCRLSNARLAEVRGVSERTIERRLKTLEARGYIHTTEYVNADGVLWRGGKGTAIRTFLRVTSENAMSPESSSLDLSMSESVVANKGGAPCSPPPLAAIQGESDETPEVCGSVQCDTTGTSPATRSDSRGNQAAGTGIDRARLWTEDEGRICVSATSAENTPGQTSVEAVAIEGGASYNPAAAVVPSGPYTGRTKHSIDPEMRWDALRMLWASAPAPIVIAPVAAEQYTLLDSVDDVPVEDVQLVPPRDSAARQKYYKLMGRAKKARKGGNRKQAAVLERQANALREPVPAVQQARVVVAAPEPEPIAPPLQTTSIGMGYISEMDRLEQSVRVAVQACDVTTIRRDINVLALLDYDRAQRVSAELTALVRSA